MVKKSVPLYLITTVVHQDVFSSGGSGAMYYKSGIRQTTPLLDCKLVNTVSDYRNKDRLTRNWVCQRDTRNIFSKDYGEPSIKHAKAQFRK